MATGIGRGSFFHLLGEKKNRTQEMSQEMSQSKGEAGPRVQLGQLERLESQENIKTWLCLPLYILKANQSSPWRWGKSPPKQGLFGHRLLQQGGRGRDSRASGFQPLTAPVSLEPPGTWLKQYISEGTAGSQGGTLTSTL